MRLRYFSTNRRAVCNRAKEFTVTAGVTPDRERFDILKTIKDRNILILDDPSFPHCFAQKTGRPGETVPIRLDGMLPSKPIHGLFGPDEVFKGKTDRRGEALIDFPIPKNATNGLHLVTIGIDGTALTADCVVDVNAEEKQPKTKPQICEKCKERLHLIQYQSRLIEQLGRILESIKMENRTNEDVVELIKLIKQQGKIVQSELNK